MVSFRNCSAVFALLALPVCLQAADQALVTAAIQKGAAKLKSLNVPAAGYNGGMHGIGTAALSGLALLEANVPKEDPSIQQITTFVRFKSLGETQTYNTALAIMYLDRHGDPADVPLIQLLGVRLYSGMNATAGWAYNTWEETPAAEQQRLAAALKVGGVPANNAPKKPDDGFAPADPKKPDDAAKAKLHPEAWRLLQLVNQSIQSRGRSGHGDDNSNTQFGIVGLWIAARHNVPVAEAFAGIEQRFLRSQNQTDAGWGYTNGGTSSASMTCAGLLGLATANGKKKSQLSGETKPPPAAPKDPNAPAPNKDDPFYNPPKGSEAPAAADNFGDGRRGRAIEAGLKVIGLVLARLQQNGAQPGGGRADAIDQFVNSGNKYYLLWSIERGRDGVRFGHDW